MIQAGIPIGIPNHTKLLRIVRSENSWMLWVHTIDFVHGTYYDLCDDGSMNQVTVKPGGIEHSVPIKPGDRR